ncbi:hypothetical protein [Ideonella sp. BN130291]|uniref:hypothetical protein n=1 Tax=Ideonella sp. BN130291 TaxID=3112940 RepID=UPI002E255DBF|nr:hypothetical protein [Ideonella sp. BN130291]
MRTSPIAIALLAALATTGACAGPALAERESVAQVSYFGAFSTLSDSGSDGSPIPVTSLDANRSLALNGLHHWDDSFSMWSFSYDVAWSVQQAFSLQPGVGGLRSLNAEGHTALGLASELIFLGQPAGGISSYIEAVNDQAFVFTLDAASRFELEGDTGGGQFIKLQRWDDPQARWMDTGTVSHLNTLDMAFDIDGQLAAGRYRLLNRLQDDRADGAPPQIDAHWNYGLVFTDVAPVPELPTPALLLAGLSAASWLARRRPRGLAHDGQRP